MKTRYQNRNWVSVSCQDTSGQEMPNEFPQEQPYFRKSIMNRSLKDAFSSTRIILWCFAVAGTILTARAGDIPKPVEILERAARTMRELKSFSAEIAPKNTNERRAFYYQRNNPDGSYETKIEYGPLPSVGKHARPIPSTNQTRNAYISNAEGRFMIRGQDVFELTYLKQSLGLVGKAMASVVIPKVDASSRYEITDAVHEAIPCYAITETLPDSSSIFKVLRASPIGKDLLGGAKLNLDDLVPVKKEYRVDKVNFFIYSCVNIGKSGNRIQEVAYQNVKTDVAFPSDFFSIPAQAKVTRVESPSDLPYHLTKRPIPSAARRTSTLGVIVLLGMFGSLGFLCFRAFRTKIRMKAS